MNRVRPNEFTEAHERVGGRGEKCGENEDMMKFDEGFTTQAPSEGGLDDRVRPMLAYLRKLTLNSCKHG